MKIIYTIIGIIILGMNLSAQNIPGKANLDNAFSKQIPSQFHSQTFNKKSISALIPEYTFSTTTYTFQDIVIFSYFNDSFFYLLNQEGTTIDSVQLNKDEYHWFSPGAGVFQINGNKSFTILIGDPINNTAIGFFAVDESGSPLSTKLNTYMPRMWSGLDHFIVFAYDDNTEVAVANITDSLIAGVAILNKGEHLILDNLSEKFISVSSSKPVSALSYTDQGYYIPSSNGTFAGTEFFGFSGNAGSWINGVVITAYHDSTEYIITNSETGDTLQQAVISAGKVDSLRIYENTFWEVQTNKAVTVSNTPYAGWSGSYSYLTRQIDESGRGIGTHFITPVVTGNYDIFSFADNNGVLVINLANQDTVFNDFLNTGEHYGFYSLNTVYDVTSSGNISIISSYSGAGGDFVPLNFAVGLPDLAISSSDINFLPDEETKTPGDVIQLNATVHNYGYETAYDVPFQFFDGDPSGGYEISSIMYKDSIPPGQSHTFSISWTIPQFPEFHAIFALVDGENSIIESNSSNNLGFKSLIPNEDLLPPLSSIIQAPTSVTLYKDSLEFDSLEIRINIFNTGTVTATNAIAILELPE